MEKYKVTIFSDIVKIRLKPSPNSKVIGLAYKGESFITTEKDGNWFKIGNGWSCMTDSSHLLLKIENVHDEKKDEITTSNIKNINTQVKEKEHKMHKVFYSPFINSADSKNSSGKAAQFIKDARGIHGMPYQFSDIVDEKIASGKFGRKFSDKILSRLPVLLMSPGRPCFMKGYSDDDKNDFLKSLVDVKSDIANKIINNKDGKLYTFKYAYKQYYQIVNSMCRIMSRLLNINNEVVYGQTLESFDWSKYINSSFKNLISCDECVAFYVDSETQISQSFSNTVSESMMASNVNNVSGMGQELQFLIGGYAGSAGKMFDKFKQENYDATMNEFKKFTDKYKSILPEDLINTLTGGITTVIAGGKMTFPQIWKDSEFSTSYDISIKLRTPDCDNLSWYLNIGVPLLHLICFAASQQIGTHGYMSPFLIRAYYKGFFNVNMGMITSMSINKGDKGRWTLNGLPTEVDVHFTIKDLYEALPITVFGDSKNSSFIDSFSNTMMLDYLANLCGINVNKPELKRSVDIIYMNVKNKVKDTLTFNGFLGVKQAISNLLSDLR